MHIIWFVLSFVFVVLEIGHPGLFYFLALSFGSFSAFIASYLQYSVYTQSIIFFMMTFLCIAILHLFIKQSLHSLKGHRSNVEQLLGKHVTVIEVRSSIAGLGKVGGEVWSIKLQQEGELQVGMQVVVVGVQGCHLKVQILES